MKVIDVSKIAKKPQTSTMFTGEVTMQPIVDSELSQRFNLRLVNFGLGVRSKFHTHSIEQILIITEGKGIVANEKEQVSVSPGDIIFIEPNEKHWHGAAPGSTMSHIYVVSPDAKTTQIEK